MPRNLSNSELLDLLDKLHSESVSITALFITSNDRIRFKGFVRGMSREHEFVIASVPTGEGDAFLSVAMPGLRFKASFGDRREFAPFGHPETDESLVSRFGDTLLAFEMEDGRALLLYFTL